MGGGRAQKPSEGSRGQRCLVRLRTFRLLRRAENTHQMQHLTRWRVTPGTLDCLHIINQAKHIPTPTEDVTDHPRRSRRRDRRD